MSPDTPGHFEALMRAGVMAARSGDFEGALGLYERALQAEPKNPVPLIYRGLTLQGMNQL